jgi:hypothetical protein
MSREARAGIRRVLHGAEDLSQICLQPAGGFRTGCRGVHA